MFRNFSAVRGCSANLASEIVVKMFLRSGSISNVSFNRCFTIFSDCRIRCVLQRFSVLVGLSTAWNCVFLVIYAYFCCRCISFLFSVTTQATAKHLYVSDVNCAGRAASRVKLHFTEWLLRSEFITARIHHCSYTLLVAQYDIKNTIKY